MAISLWWAWKHFKKIINWAAGQNYFFSSHFAQESSPVRVCMWGIPALEAIFTDLGGTPVLESILEDIRVQDQHILIYFLDIRIFNVKKFKDHITKRGY